MQTLALVGWFLIVMAMLGFIHGILAVFHLCIPL